MYATDSEYFTKYDKNYGTCYDTYAKLIIYPLEKKPEKVSEVLNISPTIMRIKGEKKTNSLGRTREIKNSIWILSSESSVNSKDLRHHLDWLIEKVLPAKERLYELQKRGGHKMYVSAVWSSACGYGGPAIWPNQMGALADLNLELSFDIYFADVD